MAPPLAVDIDGTLTRPAGAFGVDPRVLDPLREWPAPVVVATGKAFPYPVALCHFTGIDEHVVAENGGVAIADGTIQRTGDGDRARTVFREFEAAGGDPGWSLEHTVNRWRETEVAVQLGADEELLRGIADDHGMEVVDTGYAYHVKFPDVDKGTGLRSAADVLEVDPGDFVAVGDSENDVGAFEVSRYGIAVANADDRAKAAADEVVAGTGADGFLEALDRIRSLAE
jgi:phosphoglycolate phosphatase (TIGR01487 family)